MRSSAKRERRDNTSADVELVDEFLIFERCPGLNYGVADRQHHANSVVKITRVLVYI